MKVKRHVRSLSLGLALTLTCSMVSPAMVYAEEITDEETVVITEMEEETSVVTEAEEADAEEVATIVTAIGNHDEKTGTAVDAVSAALILADKCDVRRSRVRARTQADFDIHDRVNYAVTSADLKLDMEKKVITLDLQIDETMCTMYEYFEIFLKKFQVRIISDIE